MVAMPCKICRSSKLTRALHYNKAPQNVGFLLKSPYQENDTSIKLDVYKCSICGHVQLVKQPTSDYYEHYMVSLSNANKILKLQTEQARMFIERFGLKGGLVFEIGCGDGQFSRILTDHGCHVMANDPSRNFRNICRKRGLKTVDGYCGAGAFPKMKEMFDAVVARQVLEHVPDPNDFVIGLREVLKPGGVGLIEVPSLEQSIEQDRFFDFFPDHLSYFSITTLTHLFSRNMFEIIEAKRVMGAEYNEIWVKKLPMPNIERIQRASENIIITLTDFLKKEKSLGRKIAVWGAGSKGMLTLSMINDVNPISYLVDSDPTKAGLYTPISHIRIFMPSQLLANPVDTILITAFTFKDEIIRDLITKYSFKGKIAYILGGRIIVLPQKGE